MSDFIEQAKTLAETKVLLQATHKAVIIRPTGFGKTWIMTELIKDYKKVLYLYPSEVIRDTVVNRYYGSMFDEDSEEYIDENGESLDPETVESFLEMKKIDKCTLMTYAKLIRLTPTDFDEMDYDLVLFDECQRIGGSKTKIAVEKLFAALDSSTDFMGATATPTRMDNFDVVSYFFGDNMVYTYTLYDAINDGIVQRPHYCYATYDVQTDLKNAAIEAGENPEDDEVRSIIAAKAIELAKIYNMPCIIKDVCDKYTDTSYMKFIIFFASKVHMKEKIPDVESWFREAYPDHTVSTLRISSRTSQESKNVAKLDALVPTEKHIDLIACVDMLNMGYHVSDLTGILMYRGTLSSTIFIQQLGRALSVGTRNSAIVFDIVDNLHRKAIFELRSSIARKRLRGKNLQKTNLTRTDYVVKNNKLLIITSDGEKITSQYHIDESGNIVDKNGNPSTMVLIDGIVYNISDPNDKRKNINSITKDCLVATGHEASYREILAKAMAEPLTQRCKYAFELHFRSWCYKHGIDYPISDERLKRLYSLDKNAFNRAFINLVKKNKLSYPLQDADKLLAMGTNDDEIPLKICAKARNVSVSQILDMLGLAE